MTSKLIMAFVAVLIGVVLLTSTSAENVKVTKTTAVVNDTLDISTGRWASVSQDASNHHSMNSTYKIPLHTASGLDEFGDSSTDCKITGFSLRNDSNGTVAAANYNLSYDLTLGHVWIQISNATANLVQNGTNASASNNTYMSYTYCPDGYLIQSFGRTGTNTTMGLFAIAIMLIGVALFYSAYRDWKLS